MLVETSNFIPAHRAINCARLFGLIPIRSELTSKRRILVDKRHFSYNLHYLVTLFNCFTIIFAIYGIYIAHELVSNRKLPLSILVGITAAVGPFCVCVCVDILGTKNAEQICFLLNNVIKLGESIDEFKCTWTSEELQADNQFKIQLQTLVTFFDRCLWAAFLLFTLGVQVLYATDVYILIEEAAKPVIWISKFFIPEIDMSSFIITTTMIGLFVIWVIQGFCMIIRCEIGCNLALVISGSKSWILKYKLQRESNKNLNWESPKEMLWHPNNASKYYQALYLNFNFAMQVAPTLLQNCAIVPASAATITLYFAIGYNVDWHERFIFLIAFIIANCILTVFNALGDANLYSAKLTDSWSRNYICTCVCPFRMNQRWQFEVRELKTYRPLMFKAFGNYPVDKLVWLRVIDTILDKSFVLLKAFPLH